MKNNKQQQKNCNLKKVFKNYEMFFKNFEELKNIKMEQIEKIKEIYEDLIEIIEYVNYYKKSSFVSSEFTNKPKYFRDYRLGETRNKLNEIIKKIEELQKVNKNLNLITFEYKLSASRNYVYFFYSFYLNEEEYNLRIIRKFLKFLDILTFTNGKNIKILNKLNKKEKELLSKYLEYKTIILKI